MAHKRKSLMMSKDSGSDAPMATSPESDASDEDLGNRNKSACVERRPNEAASDWSSFGPEQKAPMSLSTHGNATETRKSPCVSPAVCCEETSSNGTKDDEDDDNDDDNEDDKMDAYFDSERLKAFNMFVRLFVDENLDRLVPISRQPREKVAAITDACVRQFPEFASRTRKRIRTYLKSCRRNKRARDAATWESSRPTPPHLTSIQAEQILATACENEAQNAKRMRLGLEPVAQPGPQQTATSSPLALDKTASSEPSYSAATASTAATLASSAAALAKALGGDRAVSEASKIANGEKVGAPFGLAKAAVPTSAAVYMIPNGPTDLSVKGCSGRTPSAPTSAAAVSRPALSAVEVSAVRQLITGYRESAAFLLRSADELENLLVNQSSSKSEV